MKLEEKVKKLILSKFHKQIQIFEKKKIYRKKEEIYKFINKQLKKIYIKLSKFLQTIPVFFVKKKNNKKHIICHM